MGLADPAYAERLTEALNGHAEFAAETRWFDGSILIESGAERLWLKVYRGQVIDHLDYVPPFGYTFKLTGAPEAWRLLRSGERTFTDLATPGSRHCASLEEFATSGGGYRPPELAIEGNGFEAGRLHVAILELTRILAQLPVGEPVAA
jgi:hypothetical protein